MNTSKVIFNIGCVCVCVHNLFYQLCACQAVSGGVHEIMRGASRLQQLLFQFSDRRCGYLLQLDCVFAHSSNCVQQLRHPFLVQAGFELQKSTLYCFFLKQILVPTHLISGFSSVLLNLPHLIVNHLTEFLGDLDWCPIRVLLLLVIHDVPV